MPSLKKIRLLLLNLLCSLALFGGLQVQPAAAAVSTSSRYELDMIHYANVERAKKKQVKLKGRSCVDSYAEKQAKYMATKGKLVHQSLRPILTKCKLRAVGENIAVGYSGGKTVTAAWMKSPGHRANILNKNYRMIGVGAYKDSKGRWWVSQVFGTAR